MPALPKRFSDRAKGALRRYQKVLEAARNRDVNESDTVVVVTDFLADALGYDKYEDVTTEFAVRSSFCDLAVKRSGRVQFLIEVKSINTDLRENHLKQAVDYAANQGVEWVLLTNGVDWRAHRVRFEQPIANDLVFAANLLDPDAKTQDLLEKLYMISKDAGGLSEIDQYWRHREATSRYVLAQVVLDGGVLGVIRRQLRVLFPGLKVTDDAIAELLRTEVLKRDVFEGEKAGAAEKLVKRAARRRSGTSRSASKPPAIAGTQSADLSAFPSPTDFA